MDKTPRTDSMIRAGADDDDFERGINLCRRLETELAEARAEIIELGIRLAHKDNHTMDILAERDGARAEIERKDKLIKQISEILIDELDPGEWNDGCGCCGTRLLEQTEEWKSLMAALEAAERGKQ